MPRGSKRVAARQAELSRKKKRVGYRPSVFQSPGAAEAPANPDDAPVMVTTRTGEPMPSPAPGRTAVAPAPAFRGRPGLETPAQRRNPVLHSPYLAGDMTKIGIITALLIATLVILSRILK